MENVIGVLIIVGMLAFWWVIHKTANRMRDLRHIDSGRP